MFKGEMICMFYLSQKIEAEGTLPNSACQASIILKQKLDNDIRGKENYRLIYVMNFDASILKNVTKLNPTI